jgi:hypothetical protein
MLDLILGIYLSCGRVSVDGKDLVTQLKTKLKMAFNNIFFSQDNIVIVRKFIRIKQFLD